MQHLRFSYKGLTGIKSPDGLWVILSPSKKVLLSVDSISLAISKIDSALTSLARELWTK